jgi:hypothetical protein
MDLDDAGFNQSVVGAHVFRLEGRAPSRCEMQRLQPALEHDGGFAQATAWFGQDGCITYR